MDIISKLPLNSNFQKYKITPLYLNVFIDNSLFLKVIQIVSFLELYF